MIFLVYYKPESYVIAVLYILGVEEINCVYSWMRSCRTVYQNEMNRFPQKRHDVLHFTSKVATVKITHLKVN